MSYSVSLSVHHIYTAVQYFILRFLQKCFADSELLSLKQFAIYHPVDSNTGRDIEKSMEEVPAWITGNSRMVCSTL